MFALFLPTVCFILSPPPPFLGENLMRSFIEKMQGWAFTKFTMVNPRKRTYSQILGLPGNEQYLSLGKSW